jgi:predicted MarR family transcription regulator
MPAIKVPVHRLTQTEELVLGILRHADRALTTTEIADISGGWLEEPSARVQLPRMVDREFLTTGMKDARRWYRLAPTGRQAFDRWTEQRERVYSGAKKSRGK